MWIYFLFFSNILFSLKPLQTFRKAVRIVQRIPVYLHSDLLVDNLLCLVYHSLCLYIYVFIYICYIHICVYMYVCIYIYAEVMYAIIFFSESLQSNIEVIRPLTL